MRSSYTFRRARAVRGATAIALSFDTSFPYRALLIAALLLAIATPAFSQVFSWTDIQNDRGGLGHVLSNTDGFGSSIATIGDLDGDGVVDLAVGSPYDDDGGFDFGAVYILFMKTDGSIHSWQKISGTEGGFQLPLTAQGHFGRGVASLGDIDGDDVNDIVVGASESSSATQKDGAVYVVRLKRDGTVKGAEKINAIEEHEPAWSVSFGWSVAGVGDIDGDGIPDAAASANEVDRAFYVLHLNANGSLRESRRISEKDSVFGNTIVRSDWFASAVSGIGDVDSDGIPDIAVSAADGDAGGDVFVLPMNRDGSPREARRIGAATSTELAALLGIGDAFGASITDLGDVDGDGGRDMAVGAWGDDAGETSNAGAIYILHLSASSEVKSVTKIDGTTPLLAGVLNAEDRLGQSVASLGDLDGDGNLDIATGVDWDDVPPAGWSEGAVLVLFGETPITSAVEGEESASGYRMTSLYPNPSSGASTFELELVRPSTLRISIVDVQGRIVSSMPEREFAAGAQRVIVDASNLAPGVYLVSIEGERFSASRTLTIVR